MATYLYETIPLADGDPPRRFEYRQSMKDPALTHDPESGLPVRRIITGGFAPIGAGKGIGGLVARGGCDTGTCCPECH